MSEQPTLSDLPSIHDAIDFATKLVEAYNRGELLTREEAANDPEVQRMVLAPYVCEHGEVGSHFHVVHDYSDDPEYATAIVMCKGKVTDDE